MGLPNYEITAGTILFNGADITTKSVEERAQLGIVVSFQNPPEITGVKFVDLLKLCLGKSLEDPFSAEEQRLIEVFRLTDFLNRDLNVGFSGGERKRSEILSCYSSNPSFSFWTSLTRAWTLKASSLLPPKLSVTWKTAEAQLW